MKKLIFVIFLTPSLLLAQHFYGEVNIPYKSSDQLYTVAKEWFVNTVKSNNDTILTDDQSGKKIVVNGKRQIEYLCDTTKTFMDIYFTISAVLEDYQLKYDIYSTKLQVVRGFWYTWTQANNFTAKGSREILKQNGIRTTGMIVLKPCKKCIEHSKMVNGKIESKLHQVVDDLAFALKK